MPEPAEEAATGEVARDEPTNQCCDELADSRNNEPDQTEDEDSDESRQDRPPVRHLLPPNGCIAGLSEVRS